MTSSPSPPIERTYVPSFQPSYNGYQFAADALQVPVVQVSLASVQPSEAGDIGMTLTVADYFDAGQQPPQDTDAPASGDDLFNLIANRQAGSAEHDPQRADYIHQIMSPQTPDSDPAGDLSYLDTASRARAMLSSLPRIEQDLRLGILVQLTLCYAVDIDPRVVDANSRNVLAWAYGLHTDPDTLYLWVYDPYQPGRDDMRLDILITPPAQPLVMSYTDATMPVLGFFRMSYSPQPVS